MGKSVTVLVYIALVMAISTVCAPRAVAAAPSCRIGAYITDLYGLDVSPRTINADFWLWSVCPSADLDATKRLEFVNATQVTQSDRSVEKIGNEYWSQVKVSGTFRQHFDLSEYPFDKQDVQIAIEDSEFSSSQFTYVPDVVESGYDHEISLGGFKIKGFSARVVTHTYRTSFGDPRIAHGQNSQYSQFDLNVELVRDDVAGFIRESWPAYVAFLISFITYWMWSKDLLPVIGARYGILGASPFQRRGEHALFKSGRNPLRRDPGGSNPIGHPPLHPDRRRLHHVHPLVLGRPRKGCPGAPGQQLRGRLDHGRLPDRERRQHRLRGHVSIDALTTIA
ncbi:ligand-gated ion channel [Streptomyces vinaceus]|uniref:hypothetical protein n=1 Tax=Streptomyces vinaceus TaxID=1960 RepID=UPI00367C7735